MEPVPVLVLDLRKAWSPEARAAAAAARKANGGPSEKNIETKMGSPRPSDIPASPALVATEIPKGAKPFMPLLGPKGTGGLNAVKIVENTPESTKIEGRVEAVGRILPPGKDLPFVPTNERPIDYQDTYFKEKYGDAKGEAQYQGLIDHPHGGVTFVAQTKIIAEKKYMMAKLGKIGSHENHEYQGLYKLYREKYG